MANSSLTITGLRSHRRAALAFGLLVLLPCLLSLINITFAESWKIHFFPAAIMLAAVNFGPAGGLIAGIDDGHLLPENRENDSVGFARFRLPASLAHCLRLLFRLSAGHVYRQTGACPVFGKSFLGAFD